MPRSKKSSYSPVAYSKAVGSSKKGPVAVIAGLVIIGGALLIGLWLVGRNPSSDTASAPNPAATPQSEGTPALASTQAFPTEDSVKPAWNLMNGYLIDASGSLHAIDPSAADLSEAEKLVNALLKTNPSDPEAQIIKAEIDGYYQSRGIDTSQARSDAEEKEAESAMQAAGDKPEALFAMAQAIALRSSVTNGAAQLLHQAMKIAPDELRYRRLLFHDVLKGEDSLDDATEAATKYPEDYGVQADAADIFRHFGLMEEADKAVARAVALSPDRGSTLLWKAYDAYLLRADLPAMKEALERVNGPTRQTGLFAFVSFLYASVNRDPAGAEAALRAAPKGELLTYPYPVDAAFLLASLGVGSFEAPLKAIQAELARTPADTGLMTLEVWALHGLNRDAEAKAKFEALVPTLDKPYRTQVWWLDPVALAVILGEKDTADSLLKDAVHGPSPQIAINGAKTDPRLGAWIADPTVTALLSRTE